MHHHLLRLSTLCILALSFFVPVTAYANIPVSSHIAGGLADFPTVDPNYIYDQLFYRATNFQHREAGYDKNLLVSVNGHDEFAYHGDNKQDVSQPVFTPDHSNSYVHQGDDSLLLAEVGILAICIGVIVLIALVLGRRRKHI